MENIGIKACAIIGLLYGADSLAGTFLTFDNARSVALKTFYAMEKNLKGVMGWQVAQDKNGTLCRAINGNLKPGKEFILWFPNYVTSGMRNDQVQNLEELLKEGLAITTIIFCFAKPSGDGKVLFKKPAVKSSEASHRETIEKLRGLKRKFPHLKLFLSVGGWAHKEAFFEAASDGKLKRLAFNCVKLLGQEFDGLDIDWEFQSNGPQYEVFKKWICQFINYIRQALETSDKKRYLTISLSPELQREFSGLGQIAQKVDWINLMSYNYEGPAWSELTSHNAPLYSPDLPDKRKWKKSEPKFESVDSTISAYVKAGVAPHKIVLGIPFYGRSFKGVRPGKKADGLYQVHAGPSSAFSLVAPGAFDYVSLEGKAPVNGQETTLMQSKFHYYWDDVAKVPYLFSKDG